MLSASLSVYGRAMHNLIRASAPYSNWLNQAFKMVGFLGHLPGHWILGFLHLFFLYFRKEISARAPAIHTMTSLVLVAGTSYRFHTFCSITVFDFLSLWLG